MRQENIDIQKTGKLKISVVAPGKAKLEKLRALLQSDDGSIAVKTREGGAESLSVVAETEHPDLLIFESVAHDERELALIDNVNARNASMAVILLSPNRSPEFLMRAMRIGVREVMSSTIDEEALLAAVGRVQQRLAWANAPKSTGKVLAFMPCKGGSGSTFLAANLGYALALEQKKVVLIDLNLQFGDAALFICDKPATSTVADVTSQIHRLDSSFLASSTTQVLPNYSVLAAPEEPEQAIRIKPEQIDSLLSVAVGNYDFVILDIGRSFDPISVRAMDKADLIYPVLQLTLPFVRDAKRLMIALGGLGYSKSKINPIVNRYEKRGEIRLEDLEGTLGHRIARTIPNSFSAVAASINQGVPILKLAARDPVARNLREMALELAPAVKTGGWLKGLRGR